VEVLMLTNDGVLYCLDNNGVQKWNVTFGGSIGYFSSVVADLDQDGTLEILACSEDLHCISHLGTFEWNYTLGNGISFTPSIADLDNDGLLEIVFSYGTPPNCKINCLDNTGQSIWNYTSVEFSTQGAAISDLDNDGTLEICFILYNDDTLFCINHNGILEWSYIFNSLGPDLQPIIADINADGLNEILVGTADYYMVCLGLTGVTSSGPQQWSCFLGSAFHTGQMDSDGDYMDDLTEKRYNTLEDSADSDSDLLNDWEEIYYYQTDPLDDDTDNDNVLDGIEVNSYNSDPLDTDTDNDGLTDGEEINTLGTNPTNTDTDNDGYSDYLEVNAGTDPLDPGDHPPITITLPPETIVQNQTITTTLESGMIITTSVVVVFAGLTAIVLIIRKRRKLV
ncbi:MAG: FG-GAP-like repeat-containing protein, partial [Candidatus Hodarchaeales archaeon]